MLLVVDVGNTNISLGLVRNGEIVTSRRAATFPRATSDEVESTLDSLLRLDGAALADVGSIALASVVPSLTDAYEEITGRRECSLLVAEAGTVPMPVRVDFPNEVGADRLVNALAAQRLYGKPAIVVDFGTATTLDCIDAEGAYIGGAIAPGLELGLEALAARTAKLPRIELHVPSSAIGRNTVSAMQAGSILGYQALASGLVRRTRDELSQLSNTSPEDVKVILTGGLSTTPWVRAVEGVTALDPELTLKGLSILHVEVMGTGPFSPAPR